VPFPGQAASETASYGSSLTQLVDAVFDLLDGRTYPAKRDNLRD
jgi:hypothetical protein